MADSLPRLLSESVQRAPEAEAIVYREQRVSYGELWRQVCSIAAFLREQGLEAGERVGMLIENSPEYVAVYYAVLAAGGVAVAFNTAAKARDIGHWMRHSDASWLFARRSHPELPDVMRACADRATLVTVGEAGAGADFEAIDWYSVLAFPALDPDGRLPDSAERLAAIIYTSGTTGEPKGVMQSHRNLVSNIRSILAYLKLAPDDRIVNVLPFYYTYGNSVLHTHLAVGAGLVLENSLVYPHRVLERMVQEAATGFSGVPSTYALLLARTRLEDYDLSSVRYMTQAGGPMPPAVVSRLLEKLPHIDFFIMYGQTEATARLTYLPPDRVRSKPGSVGIAIPGVRIEIRDEERFEPLPPGSRGEICARGELVTPGYWRNPEASGRIIKDGWLRTGDLGHMDEDGFLYIDGRRSDMIKSGANRISPQEIEEVIAELDAVAEVAVAGVVDEILGQVIKAFIVPAAGAALSEREVQAYCRRQLALYKIPKFIVFVEELPRTASGKIKRHCLY